MRYPEAVSPFMALPVDATNADWDDLAELAAGNEVIVLDVGARPPASWEVTRRLPVLQMTGVDATAQINTDVDRLGEADAAEMLALAERTKPGPFGLRTHELGSYFGVRREGHLIAMAGERFHPPGWVEVSGVCTDSMFWGQGLAATLMSAVVAGIRERGESPFLHVLNENQRAVDLYRRLGYTVRREVTVIALRPPGREE
jgi:predicted GNAT family acetyltransferase